MSQEGEALFPSESKDGEKKFEIVNPQQLAPVNDNLNHEDREGQDDRSIALSPIKANIILYFIVTGLVGLIAGIILYAYGKLSPQVAQIASGLSTIVALIAGVFGSTIAKSVPDGLQEIRKKANSMLIIPSSVITVVILSLAVILMPLLQPSVPSIPNPYPPYGGRLVAFDPLHDNSRGIIWDEFATGYGTCSTHDGAYHVISTQAGDYHRCGAQNIGSFSNFAYEVEMTILYGDCGALIFRGDFANYRYYYFHVCQDGSYDLYIYTQQGIPTKTLPVGRNPNINRGQNQANLVAVVAINNTLTFYVNHQSVYSTQDSTYSQGQIGLAAENLNAPPTEVTFSNLRVWKL